MKKIHIFCLVSLAVLPAFSKLFAQANPDDESFMPANPPGMKLMASHDTPAYRAAKLFQRGVNLGDYLEAGRWGVKIPAADFAQMKREGFDHVRVPVGWHRYAGGAPDFTLSPEIFARVDFAVTNTLAFELDNEPHDQATTALMNPIYAKVIAAIRETNPQRTLFVEPGGWGSINELKNLVLPPDDNVIVSVHCYEPFHFTHQGAGWVGADFQQTGIVFPGPPAAPLVPDMSLNPKPWVLEWIKKYNTLATEKNPSSARAFTERLKYVRAWSDFYGRPIHLGEFGAYTKADAQSRANFYAAFRRTAEELKIGWCIWDWNANFHYWNAVENRAVPGMHAALFGK